MFIRIAKYGLDTRSNDWVVSSVYWAAVDKIIDIADGCPRAGFITITLSSGHEIVTKEDATAFVVRAERILQGAK